MSNLLITPSLLNSFDFAVNAPPSWKVKAYRSLVSQIKREPFDPSPEIQRGIEFENKVYDECRYLSDPDYVNDTSKQRYPPHFETVVKRCLHGDFQTVVKDKWTIDNDIFVLYGKLDVDLPEKIIDIKTTGNYKGPKQYLKTWQHIMYTLLTNKKFFEYVVVEWADKHSGDIKDVHVVKYEVEDFNELKKNLINQIHKLMGYLHSHKLYDDYFYTFSNNK